MEWASGDGRLETIVYVIPIRDGYCYTASSYCSSVRSHICVAAF